MIALRWVGIDEVALEDIPEPDLTGPGHVKVRVAWAGVCVSDINIAKGRFGVEFPRTLGHEVAGEVTKAGGACTTLKPGGHVALQPTIPCGRCPACKAGHVNLCANRTFVGLHVDGGFAEYVVAPEANWTKVPAQMSLRYACLVEPVACILHAVAEMRPTPESRVTITGAGSSAYILVHALKSKGVRPENILVSGDLDARIRIISDSGARAVDTRKEDFGDAVKDHFGECGPDVFFEQTGDSAVIDASLDQLACKGTLFIYDFMGGPIPFHFGRLQLREIRLQACTGSPGTTMADAASWIAREERLFEAIITHEYEGRDAGAAFEKFSSRDEQHVKALIHF